MDSVKDGIIEGHSFKDSAN